MMVWKKSRQSRDRIGYFGNDQNEAPMVWKMHLLSTYGYFGYPCLFTGIIPGFPRGTTIYLDWTLFWAQRPLAKHISQVPRKLPKRSGALDPERNRGPV